MSKFSRTLKFTLLSGLISFSAFSFNSQMFTPLTLETESVEEVKASDQSAYEVIGDLFKSAATTKLSFIEGYHSGRCFMQNKEDQKYYSINSALVAGHYLTEENKGPLFPPKKIPYAALIYKQYAPVDFYDQISESEFNELKEFALKIAPKSKPPVQKNGSLHIETSMDDGQGGSSDLSIRVNTDYILGTLTFPERFNVKEVRCYWFKEIEIKSAE